jgi:hypothetical protein
MAVAQSGVRFDQIAKKWHALAQRRLAHVRELERSGRWKHFYSEDLACICAKPSALRLSGPSSRRPGLPRHLAEIQCFRPLETRVTAASSSAI